MNTNQIQLINIDEELNRMWEALSKGSKIRSSLFTLIACSFSALEEEKFQKVAQKVISKYPCRLIFIKVKQSGNPLLKVKTEVKMVEQNSDFACDEIFIESSPDMLKAVPSLVIPQMIPDLPIYILWGGDPVREAGPLESILSQADLVVFDSSDISDIFGFWKDLLQLCLERQPLFQDLNWARCRGWRLALAKAFDHAERIQDLLTAETVKIYYYFASQRTYPHPEIQSLYLQAWLASQLRWKFLRSERVERKLCLTYERKEGCETKIFLIPIDSNVQTPGNISCLDFSNQKGWNCCLQSPDQKQVLVHYSDWNRCELPFSLTLSTIENLGSLMNAVFNHKSKHPFCDVLQVLNSLSWR